MADFRDLLKQFKGFGFPEGQYAVFGSGPMVVRGIKEGGDLDIMVKDELFAELTKNYPIIKKQDVDYIKIADDIEICSAKDSGFDQPDMVIERAEIIDDVKFVLLSDTVSWKKRIGRPKDFEHIALIKKYLENKNDMENPFVK
ncbi:MAG: hypothetical protein PHE77_03435 [Candidatus Pacebacteria bacterium]|nr:hypothetical protein [Candidatus Paceibacterota bacterium]